MLMGRWVNTPIGPVYVPHGWRLWISKPWIVNYRGRDPRKFERYRVVISPPYPKRDNKRFKWRKWKTHAFHVLTTGARYRVKDLDSGLFLVSRGSRRILGNTVLGKIQQIQNGKIVSSGLTLAGSDLSPTLNQVSTWDLIHPGPPYKAGGPFKSVQVHLPASKMVGNGTYTDLGRSGTSPTDYCRYVGSFVDNGSWLGESYSTIAGKGLANFPSLSPYHTAAWDMLKPKLPQAGLAQFIYELKDLPGQLQTTAELFHLRWADLTRGTSSRGAMVPYMSPKEAANQFLNEEFGWKPFLSDIWKLHNAFLHSSEMIAKIVRDNGQWIRKRRVLNEGDVTLPEATIGVDSATIPSSSMRGPTGFPMCKLFATPAGQQAGFSIQSNRTIEKTWAVGSFKYYRPEFDPSLIDGNSFDLVNSANRLITLYGLRINPTLVYKVYPWTWAVDYFTGLGKYIERLDDFVQDGIVSRGLYVCSTQEKISVKTSILNFYSGQIALNFVRRYTFKNRELADSPYGFNVPWNTITPRQWAILGAIGISRSGAGYISRGA